MATKEKKSPVYQSDTTDNNLKKLILWNDDVNSFDFVIKTLIEVCGHDPYQAETCTLIIHYKGKCAVKNGTFNELSPMLKEMINRNLTAEIR